MKLLILGLSLPTLLLADLAPRKYFVKLYDIVNVKYKTGLSDTGSRHYESSLEIHAVNWNIPNVRLQPDLPVDVSLYDSEDAKGISQILNTLKTNLVIQNLTFYCHHNHKNSFNGCVLIQLNASK